LKVSVPLGPEEIEEKAKEMKEMRDKFLLEGERMLKEEEEKLGDLESGKLDTLDEEYVQDPNFERRGGSRGGRGLGRGGRGSRGSGRGGRGGHRNGEEGDRR